MGIFAPNARFAAVSMIVMDPLIPGRRRLMRDSAQRPDDARSAGSTQGPRRSVARRGQDRGTVVHTALVAAGRRRVVVLRLGVPGQPDHRGQRDHEADARPATPGPARSGRRAAAARRSRRAPRRRRPSRRRRRSWSPAASPGRAAADRPSSGRSAGRAAGRATNSAERVLDGQRSGGDRGRGERHPGQRAEHHRTERAVQAYREEAEHARSRRAPPPGRPHRRCRAGGEGAGCAASTSAVIPAKSSTSSATSAAGSRHFSTSTPSRAVTPSPAATLACTRNSGRSRRARKASTKPIT